MAWELNSLSPVYSQLADRIRSEILKGAYPSGEQLPAVRILAVEAGVNPNTMQRALTQLEGEGLLFSKGTAGRYVTEDGERLKTARERMKTATARRLAKEAADAGITLQELAQAMESLAGTEKQGGNEHE